MSYKRYIFSLAACFLILSCGLLESNGDHSIPSYTVYVALQGLDQVGIINTGTGKIMEIDMGMGDMTMGHTPHFIVIDTTSGYLFVTTIMSGYVSRYDLETNTLIDKIDVGDLPALMVLNENKKNYMFPV